MSKIVISGYYGFANAGDEAMLTAIIKALRSTEKTVELTVISGNPPATAARHKVNSLHRFSFCKFLLPSWTATCCSAAVAVCCRMLPASAVCYIICLSWLWACCSKKGYAFRPGYRSYP